MYRCILMDYLCMPWILTPTSPMGRFSQISLRIGSEIRGRQRGWKFHVRQYRMSSIEGKKWKMNTSAESEAPRMVGRAHSESFKWLPFLIFRLWGCKVGQSVIPSRNTSYFSSSQDNPHKTDFLWDGRKITSGENYSFLSAAFSLLISWQYGWQDVSAFLHCWNKGLFQLSH